MPYPSPSGENDPTLNAINVIIQVAREYKIPPELALAIAYHESGFNTKAVGDNGSSFGLFQLHQGGELGSHTRAWAEDPYNNARTALAVVAHVYHSNPNLDWGSIGAAAQRPADRAGYAKAINTSVSTARKAKEGPVNYFLQNAGLTPVANRYLTSTASGSAASAGAAGYSSVTRQAQGGIAGGGTTVTINQPGGGGDKVPQLTQADFKAGVAEAGFSMGLIKSDKELNGIFNKAIKGGWFTSQNGINRFLNSVQNSRWFRTRSNAQRTYDDLNYSNPAEARRKVAAAQASIGTLAQTMGIQLNASQVAALAKTTVRNGLSDQEVHHSITGFYHFDPHQELTGEAAVDVSSIRAIADSYYVPVDDKTIGELSGKMLDGTLDQNALTAYFQQHAISMFPQLQKQIEQGLTVDQIASPYKKMMADTLELPGDNAITYNDPTVMKALQQPVSGTADKGGTGTFQLMPLWQFQQTLKQDPRWLRTNNARDTLMDLGGGLLKSMGLTA